MSIKLIRGLHNIRSQHRGCVLSIGNFDGIHLGHQSLIQQLVNVAKARTLHSTIILFEPQPSEFFLKDKAFPRLMRLREKIKAIQKLGVQQILILPFNKTVSNFSREYFVQHILLKKLDVHYMIVGDDFRFGKDRLGDVSFLKVYDINVEVVDTQDYKGKRVSSTYIREALKEDDLTLAETLLGRPFVISGCVIHGNKKGRIIGFPTANLRLHRKNSPLWGVYAVKIAGVANNLLEGVANIGIRPTIDGTRTLLEVHIFNFEQMIYGQYIDVIFVHKLRDEVRFDSFDALKQQIFKDAEAAREVFEKQRCL